MILLFYISLVHVVLSWPDGAPCLHAAYESMNPLEAVEHQGGLQLTMPPYVIKVDQKCYWRNQPLTIHLQGENETVWFKGFVIQPYEWSNGRWGARMGQLMRLDDNGSWQQQCFRFKNSATHSHDEKKKHMRLWWKADEDSRTVQFVATVVKHQTMFWVKSVLSVPIPPCRVMKQGILEYTMPMPTPPPPVKQFKMDTNKVFGNERIAPLPVRNSDSTSDEVTAATSDEVRPSSTSSRRPEFTTTVRIETETERTTTTTTTTTTTSKSEQLLMVHVPPESERPQPFPSRKPEPSTTLHVSPESIPTLPTRKPESSFSIRPTPPPVIIEVIPPLPFHRSNLPTSNHITGNDIISPLPSHKPEFPSNVRLSVTPSNARISLLRNRRPDGRQRTSSTSGNDRFSFRKSEFRTATPSTTTVQPRFNKTNRNRFLTRLRRPNRKQTGRTRPTTRRPF